MKPSKPKAKTAAKLKTSKKAGSAKKLNVVKAPRGHGRFQI